MTKRERFIKALSFQQTTPVPYSIKFTVEAKENYRAYLGRDFDPIEETGTYVVASHTNANWQEVRPGYYRDYFGVIWNKTQDRTLGVVEKPVLEEPTFKGFTFPDPDDLPVYSTIEENNKNYPDLFHMVSIGFTQFERAWTLCGMDTLMIWMLTEPDFVSELMQRIADYNCAIIRNAAQLGVDCVHYGDDWGTQRSLIISPEMWQQFVRPHYVSMCSKAKQAGLFNSLHSCGKVDSLIPEMIKCGIDVFDPFQPEVMDIRAVQQKYHGKIAFWGGLSVQRTMPFGTPEDVRRECEQLVTDLSPRGGYILSPSHSVSGDVPPENIKAFLDYAQDQQ